jgi:hypothetical protein
MAALKPGTKLRSSVDTTEIVVVKGTGQIDLRCGGEPMVPVDGATGSGDPAPGFAGGTTIGKRYASADGLLELLCVRAGAGSLSIGDEIIALKDAKPLPASD